MIWFQYINHLSISLYFNTTPIPFCFLFFSFSFNFVNTPAIIHSPPYSGILAGRRIGSTEPVEPTTVIVVVVCNGFFPIRMVLSQSFRFHFLLLVYFCSLRVYFRVKGSTASFKWFFFFKILLLLYCNLFCASTKSKKQKRNNENT